MKLYVLILYLAVLTVTWASVLRDEPKSKLEKLIKQGEEDVENFYRNVKQKLSSIERSEVSRELSELIKPVYDNIWMRLVTLREELPSEVVQTLDTIVEVPYNAASKAGKILYALLGYVGPHSVELHGALQSALEAYAEPILEKVGPYAATVRGAVVSGTQEIILKMDEKILPEMETLKTRLEPYAKKFQEAQPSLEPYLDHTGELFRKGLETIHKNFLKPYVAPTLETCQKVLVGLRGWPVLFRNP